MIISLALCAGNSAVTEEFPAQKPVTRSFDVFFDLRLNKRLSKQSWGWWFETTSHPLWRHSNHHNGFLSQKASYSIFAIVSFPPDPYKTITLTSSERITISIDLPLDCLWSSLFRLTPEFCIAASLRREAKVTDRYPHFKWRPRQQKALVMGMNVATVCIDDTLLHLAEFSINLCLP